MAGGYEEEKGILVVVLIQWVEKPTPGSWKDEIYKSPECIPFFCTVTGKKWILIIHSLVKYMLARRKCCDYHRAIIGTIWERAGPEAPL